MVNVAQLLALGGAGNLQKRQQSVWSDVVSTSWDLWSEATSATVFGYYTTTAVVSAGTLVTSTIRETTSTTWDYATLPLLSPSPLDAACTSQLSAWNRNLSKVTMTPQGYVPMFEVGGDPSCLPTGYYTVAYYSPGICPTGYTLAINPPRRTGQAGRQTAGPCCYEGYTWDLDWGCASSFNPGYGQALTGTDGAAFTDPVTSWTEVAEYTTVATSTSIYSGPVAIGSLTTTLAVTSRTEVQTTTGQTIISGDQGLILGPPIYIRWESTDTEVVAWYNEKYGNPSSSPSVGPEPSKVPEDSTSLSGGAIAGIAIGAVAALALVIGALLMWLRKRKRDASAAQYAGDDMGQTETRENGSHGPVFVQSVVPKTELDSRALSAEQYAAQSAYSSPQMDYKPFVPPPAAATHDRSTSNGGYTAYRPPPSEVEGTEINAISPSVAGSNVSPPDRAQSPSAWTDTTAQPETDMSGFMIKDGGSNTPQRTSIAQLERLKEERARLQRLQDIAEQEARLEEQLERELAAERQA